MIRLNPHVAVQYMEDNHKCRQSAGNDKFRVRECPVCGSPKWNASFRVSTQTLTSFCCDKNINIIELVKRDHGLKTLPQVLEHLKRYGAGNVIWGVSSGKALADEVTKTQMLRDMIKAVMRPPVASPVSKLSLVDWSVDWNTRVGKQVYDYACRRGVPDWFRQTGRMGYFTSGPMMGRLTFLVYENGSLVYAVARAIDDKSIPKYLVPHPNETGDINSSDVVFNLDLWPRHSVIIVHEGVLSALSGERGSVATLGKGMSSVQISKIALNEPEAVLVLREPGVDPVLSESYAYQFAAKGCFALTAPLVNGDFNDDPTQFDEVVKGAHEVTRFSFLRTRLAGRKMV